MKGNESMVEFLKTEGVLRTQAVINAFRMVDRAQFVPYTLRSEAYADHPLPIPAGQAISQPYTVAFMIELLSVQKGMRVLDVGSGSGWTTALLAQLVGKEGSVIGEEIRPILVEYGRANLAKYGFTWAKINIADGKTIGAPKEAPFDRILVSANSRRIPYALIEQLRPGGIMVIPIDGKMMSIVKGTNGKLTSAEHGGIHLRAACRGVVMEVRVKVSAGKKEEFVRVLPDGRFEVAVRAPRKEGKANLRMRELLCEHFHVSMSGVRIIAGHTSGTKRVVITKTRS